MAIAAGAIKNEKFRAQILKVSGQIVSAPETDTLAIEEPLEIRVGFTKDGVSTHRAISITMRTPGSDFELAAGFLFTEGILQNPEQITAIRHCGKFPNNQNTVRIDLSPETEIDFKRLERNFYTTSSCGVCGKTSLEALATGATALDRRQILKIKPEVIHKLPETLLGNQSVFDETGGLHAAALFDAEGELLGIREDVGRHNAVDKLIGTEFLNGNLPLSGRILFLSGRASFELLQKAVMAQIPIVAAVGAPSSLAAAAAREFGITLLGFVRDGRFNVYTGGQEFDSR